MPRTATWVVVAGVLLVGGVAAVEAFLRDGEATVDQPDTGASTAPATPRGGTLAAQLEAVGARGLLYVTVEAGDGCELRAVRLPRLTAESSFPVSDCRFAVAPDGAVATGSDCRGDGALATFDGTVVDFFAGCAPAFKPDGELTFVRTGNVMTVPRSCTKTIDACARVVVSRRDIRRAFAELAGDPPGRETVREIAWLDDSRLGVIVRRAVGTGEDLRTLDFVVVFEGQRFLGPLRFATGRLTDLAVDRPGRRFYASGDVVQGVVELDDWGRYLNTLTLPQGSPEVSSIAFSPDGAWGAAAGRDTVVLFQPSQLPGTAFQLPIHAKALAWRGP